MRRQRLKLADWWIGRGGYILAIIFVIVFFYLMVGKHNAFNTRTYDFARFDQAVWNTLHGRFLFSSVSEYSILGDHFSPLLAFLSPLFLIWPDERALFLVQVVSLAVAGLFLAKMVQVKHPALAPWFLLAFYLNPAVHDVTLFEFRRVVPAIPFLALAFYALYVRKRWLMVLGLGVALLAKENIGFIVFMVGVYLLLFERDRKWGVPLMVLGAGWVVVVSLWVIPIFAPPTKEVYPQLYYFDFLGSSYQEVINALLADPLIVVRQMFGPGRVRGLLRVFLPLGLVLPFMAPAWLLISVPTFSYSLLSADPDLYQLEKWYMATVLPVLFAAVAVGLGRRSYPQARRLTAVLLVAAIVGYGLFSPAPLGGRYDPSLYEVTDHHRLAATIVAAVPPEASVATQPHYVPHLAHRQHIYHYPWIAIGKENIDYFVFDRQSSPYPFGHGQFNAEVDNMVSDPAYVVEMEADGIYLIRTGGEPLPSFSVGRVAEGAIKLERYELAVQDGRGFFVPMAQEPVRLEQGQSVRVTLYWEALAAPEAERTVSVRIADASGTLVAQHDGLPAKGSKPTSWWQPGWRIRDVYYLTVSAEAQPGPGSLDVLLYNTYNYEIVPFEGGDKILNLHDITVVSPAPDPGIGAG